MSDAARLLVDHLDIWTGATERKNGAGRSPRNGNGGKLSLYGIEKLRSLIRDLAVRGKLVPQDPNDEPASELLKRVYQERNHLIAARMLSKPKPIRSEHTALEALVTPRNWARDFFGNIFSLEYGDNLPKRSRTESGEVPVYGSNGVVGTHSEGCVDAPCIVVGRKGSAGAVNRCQAPSCWVTDVAFYCIPPTGFDLRFAEILFLTLKLVELGKGIKPGLNRNEANALPICFPPLAEQRRIVVKVDELMALCDALEVGTHEAMAAHETLVRELLATLVNSQDADDLAANWSRIETHFDTLFTTEASIDVLKRAIVELAVKGIFSAAIDETDPASIELAVLNEKNRKLESGARKSRKELVIFSGLDDLREQYSSASGLVRIDDIAEVVRGGSPRPAGDPRFYHGDIPFLKVADVTNISGKYVEGHTYTIKEAGLRKTRFVSDRVVLLTNSGATLGKAAILNFPASFNDGVAAFLEMSEHVFDEYLYLVLTYLSPWFLAVAARGQGQPNLNTDIIRSTWIPVPSLTTQKEIVKLVDELWAFCDSAKPALRLQNEKISAFALSLTG